MSPRFVHPAPGRQPAPQGSFGPPPARSLGVSFGYFLGPTPALPASPYGHVWMGDGRCCGKRRPAKPPRSVRLSQESGSAAKGAACSQKSGPSGGPARYVAVAPTTIRPATPRGSPRGHGVRPATVPPAKRVQGRRTSWPNRRGASDRLIPCAVRATARGRRPCPL